MIQEDFVNFETAKLLKEKGFNELTPLSYSLPYGYESHVPCCNGVDTDFVSRITLQMAMKWLREVQGLNIYVRGVWKDVEVQYGDWESVVAGYEWFVESLMDDTYSKMSIEQFLTYENACEAAIKYCLENLI